MAVEPETQSYAPDAAHSAQPEAPQDHPAAPEEAEMNKDQIWRDKLRALCKGLGAAGDAVYNEIEGAVDARIDEARENAEHIGREYGYWQGNATY